MLGIKKISKVKFFIVILILLFAILLTLFQHYEIDIDIWGYWMNARIISETGKLPILERGPPYSVYLTLFRLLPYPNSVTVEYVVTSLITVVSLVMFLNPYFGLSVSTISAVLWIPYLQLMHPNSQKLALSCTFWAMIIRRKISGRFGISLSYAVLMLAYFFRPNYLYFLIFFLLWDTFLLLKQQKEKILQILKPHLKTDWPILVVATMFVCIQVFQSPNPWNNIFWGTTTWFPMSGKSNNILPFVNNWYITQVLGTTIGNDWYFTNKEILHGASDNLGALKANPLYILRMVQYFVSIGVPMITNMTMLPKLFLLIFNADTTNVLILILIMGGALLAIKEKFMKVFVLAHTLVVFLILILSPSPHYFISMVPILTLSGFWYGKQIYALLTKRKITILKLIVTSFMIFVFISGPSVYYLKPLGTNAWIDIISNIINESRKKDLRVLELRAYDDTYSWKASYSKIVPLLKNCKGILSQEHAYLAAFTDISLSKLYDIWEIPPYGYLNHSVYTGLRPDRIDCVLVSHDLQFNAGTNTSVQMRYDLYIRAYTEQLLALGAKKYTIDKYGDAFILPAKIPLNN
jgi:hypothetical protein